MIRRLKYHEIDFVKYQKTLSGACQLSDFAQKEFLNIVAGKNWGLLVYGDYEAVMPVAWSNNFGIKIVQMPILCHQLGVFSKEDNIEINHQFYLFLMENFAISYYAFNKDNGFPIDLQQKKSYKIAKNTYENVKKNYHIHRRRNVRHTADIKEFADFKKNIIPGEKIEDFFLENIKGIKSLSLRKKYWNVIKKLIEAGFFRTCQLTYKDELKSFAGIYSSKQANYLSIFISTVKLENKNIPSIIIDDELQHSIADKDFDFMGSNVPNVAAFNERFGAEVYYFSILVNKKLNVIIKVIKLYFRKNR
ncbi:hypothetical protein [Chryseobacterium soli]|uniref:hypothetical protein n=1 Tax=Chryseobacterium soli TaxID=445961 RepID=UPI0006911A7F|nr:hypothetical protein [Chryseobacterium soli]